jgi:hypothetical protein
LISILCALETREGGSKVYFAASYIISGDTIIHLNKISPDKERAFHPSPRKSGDFIVSSKSMERYSFFENKKP